eukprot:20399-Heterococcus_DN1.PRE.3
MLNIGSRGSSHVIAALFHGSHLLSRCMRRGLFQQFLSVVVPPPPDEDPKKSGKQQCNSAVLHPGKVEANARAVVLCHCVNKAAELPAVAQ